MVNCDDERLCKDESEGYIDILIQNYITIYLYMDIGMEKKYILSNLLKLIHEGRGGTLEFFNISFLASKFGSVIQV